jgi:hypothetical protein
MTENEQARFAENLLKLSPWERDRYMRFLLLLLNKSPKAVRLAEMADRRQITRRQLFEAI